MLDVGFGWNFLLMTLQSMRRTSFGDTFLMFIYSVLSIISEMVINLANLNSAFFMRILIITEWLLID